MLLIFVSFLGCKNQKEKKLIEENKQLMQEHERLDNEIDSIEMKLKLIEKRDSILMQQILSDTITKIEKEKAHTANKK